jgi:glutaredoxin
MQEHHLTLYTRVNCHLCELAKEALDRVQSQVPFALEVVDVDSSTALQASYGNEVPVVLLDGEKVAALRLDEAALLERLGGALR